MTVTASPTAYPKTIIVVHKSEKAKKCSVAPLRGNPEFDFYRFPGSARPNLENYVRLGMGGPELGAAEMEKGLLVLDGTWRRAAAMEKEYRHVPVRTLPSGWRTAYPRVSKVTQDPDHGLATIEAIFAALSILGRDTAGLLDHYHWQEQFLALNRARLKTGH